MRNSYNKNMKKLISSTLILSALTCGCTNVNKLSSLEANDNTVHTTERQVKNIHPIDIAQQNCLDKNDTTVGMNKCVYQAMDAWSLEIEKYLALLKNITTEGDYKKITEAQKDWEVFKESEFEAIGLVVEKQGTMFQNSTVGLKAVLVKERALNLKEFYDTLSYEN